MKIADALYQVIADEPGIDGYTLVDRIEVQFGEWVTTTPIQDIVWDQLDAMQESEMIWLNDQEDAWYLMNSPEAEAAMIQYTK